MPIDFSRRDFLKKTGLLAAGAGVFTTLPASIQKALAINPAPGSSFEDAEHIVLLMQENRSFDHCFGSLKGVRGFNDPRALRLADQNPVWLQTSESGQTYGPFRLDMQQTKITWMGGLPHSWEDQVDARNGGRYDQWLNAKRTGYKGFEDQPMTLGYYTREDIPFNYALADAFTVCDQHFCSSLTGTTPNRLYFWSGTLRKDGLAKNPALVRNSESDYGDESEWKTLPELLEEEAISWKVYQNELSLPSGLADEAEAWLGNFTDNPLEWFRQYKVRRSEKYRDYLIKALPGLAISLRQLEEKMAALSDDGALKKEVEGLRRRRDYYQRELDRSRNELAEPQSAQAQAIHNRAFVTNDFDPDYHRLEEMEFEDQGKKKKMKLPASDVLAAFRRDVKSGQLPAVSWLVAPQYFSDHPSAPWFGAWYLSEVLDILTHNEEVWKKTIFILTYDENDGYFDHVPPFVAPDYRNPESGAVSASIKDIANEYVTLEDETVQKKVSASSARQGPIGLGYRVPFIVASPWTRGGYVNSQVFDHTSVVQFIEQFVSRKKGRRIQTPFISDWRRAVCGDLSSVFRPYQGQPIAQPAFLEKEAFLKRVEQARFRPAPPRAEPFDAAEIAAIRQDPGEARNYYRQEPGIKPASVLPYELYAEGHADAEMFRLQLRAGTELFGSKSAGSPFNLYAYKPYGSPGARQINHNWSFAVAAGEALEYTIPLDGFENGNYHFMLFGPNGFCREFMGSGGPELLDIQCSYVWKGRSPYGQVALRIRNRYTAARELLITDNSYGNPPISRRLEAGAQIQLQLNLDQSFGWYNFMVTLPDMPGFRQAYSGRVEGGKDAFTDPAMG
ncbi:phosphocholine-specific phospholipase C [Niabella terrae]